MNGSPTGPLTAAQMQALAEAPAGVALRTLRQHDPLWGRPAGETFPWRVSFTETVRMRGYVTVQASTEEEAIEAAEALAGQGKVTCDSFVSSEDIELEWAEPA